MIFFDVKEPTVENLFGREWKNKDLIFNFFLTRKKRCEDNYDRY